MNSVPDELEEIRVTLERLRTLLENLVIRGLRACGPDELKQLHSFAEHLDQTGAGHLAAVLLDLHKQIKNSDRASARQLLEAQTNVRLLERLLTLRVVKAQLAFAAQHSAQDDLSNATDPHGDTDCEPEDGE